MATVVAKLLIAAEPDRAFFGQKDAAQVAVLRRMVADLRLAAEIVVCPIVREADGLALSSRNVYLSAAERKQALVLSRAVWQVEAMAAGGERSAGVLIEAARQSLRRRAGRAGGLYRAGGLGDAGAGGDCRAGKPLCRRRLGGRYAADR